MTSTPLVSGCSFMVGLCVNLSSKRATFFFSARWQVSARSSTSARFKLYANALPTSSANSSLMLFSHFGPFSPCSRVIFAAGLPPVCASPSVK